MRLIGLAVVLVLSLLVAPLTGEAQQTTKIAQVGFLSPSGRSLATDAVANAFEQSLRDLRWVRDQNVRIDARYSGGQSDVLSSLAAELVSLGVDVLVAWGPAGALAAKRATSQMPIVFLAAGDPVGLGLVSSLARPGGNVTGVSFDASPEIYGKKMELLKEVAPGVARVAILVTPETRLWMDENRQTILATHKALNLDTRELEVQAPVGLAAAIRKGKDDGAQALYVLPSGFAFLFAGQISELALAQRLPSIHAFRESAVAGGLLSYGPSLTHIAQRGAGLVDKILKGAKPANLPVEQPTKFELAINLKTARALGLTIPPSVLGRADQVIE